MMYHFSPDRQGAAHALDERHLVLTCGTPRWINGGLLEDTRIRISEDGSAERAVWISHSKHQKEPGLHAEFHRWDLQVTEQRLAEIRDALQALEAFPKTDPDEFSNDSIRLIRFHADGAERQVCILDPPDQLGEPVVTAEESGLFWNAWNLIDRSAPAGDL